MKEKRLEKPRAAKKKRCSKNVRAKKDTATQAYDKWVKVRSRLDEADVERKRLIHTIADSFKKVLPSSTFDQKVKPRLDALHSGTQTELLPPPPSPTPAKRHILFSETPKRARRSEQHVFPSTSSDVIYESTTPPPIEIRDDDDDDVETEDPGVEPEVLAFGQKTFGEVASPYVSPYVYRKRFLDTENGIRKVGNTFMIGDSRVGVDEDSNIHIQGAEFPARKVFGSY